MAEGAPPPRRLPESERYLRPLAELAVRLGANLQPGQVLAIASEPGKEPLARAIAEVAYEAGALFVDLSVFDIHLKRLRALKADPARLDFVPPWIGARVLALGEHRCARIALTGPVAPRIMHDVDPSRLGRDILPTVRESLKILNDRTTNWTAVPCPTPGWAALVHPQLDEAAALARLWEQVARICRLEEPDPLAAWTARIDQLLDVTTRLDALAFDALRLRGPGTDLTIGLLPSSQWLAARFRTVEGIEHVPNLPTEEVFTTPDPLRADGVVRATKPLFSSGTTITGLEVHFAQGRAVRIEAEQGAEVVRSLSARDPGAARLGEVALVDREGRIGQLRTTFFDTLVDENAASHIALGQGYLEGVRDQADLARVNASELHLDFMVGSEEIVVTGVTRDGAEVPVLEAGRWQI